MKATFVLTPAEARRLIAKAVIQTPEFQKAWKDAYVLLAGGTTNAFIAQELGYEADPGLYCLSSADILTEADAIRQMFHCDAKVVCAGGIGGNEGAHYWAVDGEEADVKALVEFLEKNIKGEPAVKGNKGNCANCRYPGCKYNGLKPEDLPKWMKKKGIET